MKAGGPWPWTPEEDKRIAKMRRDGMTIRAIAAALGRTPWGLQRHLHSRQYTDRWHQGGKRGRRRKCLSCGRMFEPKEDYRICEVCHASDEWQVPTVELPIVKRRK